MFVKYVTKWSVLVAMTLVGLSLLCAAPFQTSHILQAEVIGADVAPQSLRNDVHTSEELKAVQVVLDYVDLSKTEERLKVKELCVDIRTLGIDLRKFEQDVSSDDPKVGNGNDDGPRVVSPDTSNWDSYQYEILTEDEPKFIKNRQLAVKNYTVTWLDEKRCRIKVSFTDKNGIDLQPQDYLLIKKENQNWKLYKMVFPSGFEM